MTLRELLIYLLTEENENLLDKKLAYCERKTQMEHLMDIP